MAVNNLFIYQFLTPCSENTWVYERDQVTGIHFEFCKIALNYAFNLVDVDQHCIYCTKARKFSAINKGKERKNERKGHN